MGWGKYNENWKETAMKEIKIFLKYMIACLLIALFLAGCATVEMSQNETTATTTEVQADIPAYNGMPYIQLENNMPDFSDEEKTNTEAFEIYSDLDSLGRCGQAYANICL